MENVFWIGVYPALKDQHIEYMLDTLHEIAENAFHRGGTRPADASGRG